MSKLKIVSLTDNVNYAISHVRIKINLEIVLPELGHI
jgi:hypothetical protein